MFEHEPDDLAFPDTPRIIVENGDGGDTRLSAR